MPFGIAPKPPRTSLPSVLRGSAQASIDRRDKSVGCSRAGGRRVTAVVIAREARALDLLERLSLADRVLHAIPNDRHHITILGDIAFVVDPAAVRYHHRASLRAPFRYREVENAIQCRERAVHSAAVGQPNDGIGQILDNAARDDDVGLAEKHEHVAVTGGRRHVNDLDRLVVEEELARAAEKRVGRRMPV